MIIPDLSLYLNKRYVENNSVPKNKHPKKIEMLYPISLPTLAVIEAIKNIKPKNKKITETKARIPDKSLHDHSCKSVVGSLCSNFLNNLYGI